MHMALKWVHDLLLEKCSFYFKIQSLILSLNYIFHTGSFVFILLHVKFFLLDFIYINMFLV